MALKNKALHLSIMLLALHITGCVGLAGVMGASVQGYEGPERPDSEVATLVKTQSETAFRIAYVKSVDDEVYGDDVLRGWPSTVKVLPGVHKIEIKCVFAGMYAFPSMQAELKAGMKYEVNCIDLGNGYAQAAISELKV